MQKTSPRSGGSTPRVVLDKKDAYRAAKARNPDFGPLIRILDDAIQKKKTEPNRPPPLYLKHDAKHAKPFITTDYQDPRQDPSELQESQWSIQYIAATDLIGTRVRYCASVLSKRPEVVASAEAVLDFCKSSTYAFNEDGTSAAKLRRLLQDLNNALNPSAPATDAESPGQDSGKEKKEKGKSSWFSRRSHKHPPESASPQASSQPTSPRNPSTESNSLNVPPRAPDQSFAIQPPPTLIDPPANSGPPLRPLPPLPAGATSPRSPGTNTAAHEPTPTAPDTDPETLRFS